jgi:hypothetical protein
MTDRITDRPGQRVPPLTEGSYDKGGHNTGPSQVQVRPPPPAAINPRPSQPSESPSQGRARPAGSSTPPNRT